MTDQDELSASIEDATQYLETGGLGEMIVLAQMSWDAGHKKIQMDTDIAIALCLLVDDAMKARSKGAN